MIRRTLRHFIKPKLDPHRQQVKDWLMPILPRDPIIVEAGSHWGEDTIWLGRYWPHGMVHTFEPEPECFRLTTRHTSWIRNVRRYPFALSDRVETVEFHISGGASSGSSSMYAPKHHLVEFPQVTFEKKITVPTITLELWAQQYGVERIDFLWLDMQGAELRALKAMGKLLETVRAMNLEVSTEETYAGAPKYPELKGWLVEHGFKVKDERFDLGTQGDVFVVR